MSLVAYFYWNPSPYIFNYSLPVIDRPLGWYGVLFALGFIMGYAIMIKLITRELRIDGSFTPAHIAKWKALMEKLQAASNNPIDPLHRVTRTLDLSKATKEEICAALIRTYDRSTLETLLPNIVMPINDVAFSMVDKGCWFVVAGAIIGARLGHVFFYGWDYYRHHLSDIPKIWEGGLASHGGAIGILVAIFLFNNLIGKRSLPSFTFLRSIDLLAVPTALAAFFIRLGNFFNQEIIGTVTDLPWGVLFGNPWEGGPALPRHPVQLYEGIFYLFLFFALLSMWRKGWHRQHSGVIAGTFFIAVFGWRILMEFLKSPQGGLFADSFLETGQMLSIPFVVIGLWLVFYPRLRQYCSSCA
ncbi:MAG: prolipoprotein diacylglyceryl transferase [Chlamydiales bacterium]|nr:prolipoprotein diacylglyceryl transferase [Chlamydiales bacterium]